MIVGSCGVVGPLACLLAGSVVLTAIAFAAIALFTAFDRARKQRVPSQEAPARALYSSNTIKELKSE
ncbi:MAG: hypothetical protein NVS4B5_19350 [Vulcanimicrobiaceae bacterium]